LPSLSGRNLRGIYNLCDELLEDAHFSRSPGRRKSLR
jgi:hypothetical protein